MTGFVVQGHILQFSVVSHDPSEIIHVLLSMLANNIVSFMNRKFKRTALIRNIHLLQHCILSFLINFNASLQSKSIKKGI